MDIAVFHGLWTAALLVIFVGIVIWAWSGKRKRDFDEAAHIPFDGEEPDATSTGTKRDHND